MFWTRLLSSVTLLAVTIFLVVFGGLPLIAFIGIISILGLFELYRVLGFAFTPLAYLCYFLAAAYEVMVYFSGLSLFSVFIILSVLALLMTYVFCYPSYDAKAVMGAFFGLIYVVVMLTFIYVIRIMPAGSLLVWLIFISAWGSDTLAYCVGMLFGKHKLTPVLSPKKTVEGFIGGILGALLLGAIFTLVFSEELLAVFNNPMLCVLIIVLVCSAVSVVGDLAASAIKRNHDVKDYGNLIPGHGGILDRYDSIIVTAPAVFLMTMLLAVLEL